MATGDDSPSGSDRASPRHAPNRSWNRFHARWSGWDASLKIGFAALALTLCGVVSWTADGLAIIDRFSSGPAPATGDAGRSEPASTTMPPAPGGPSASGSVGTSQPSGSATAQPSESTESAHGSAQITEAGGIGVEAVVKVEVTGKAATGNPILLVRYASSGRTLHKWAGDLPNKIGIETIKVDISRSQPCSDRDFAVFHLAEGASRPPGPTGNGVASLPPGLTKVTSWFPHERKDDRSESCPD